MMEINTSGIGIIIQKNSGVFYTNQTGGYACHHPKVRGIYIPFPSSLTSKYLLTIKLQEELDSYFYGNEGPWKGHCYLREGKGLTNIDADWLDSLFMKYELPIKVDRNNLNCSEEAWIWIDIVNNSEEGWEGIKGKKGVFVWENSD